MVSELEACDRQTDGQTDGPHIGYRRRAGHNERRRRRTLIVNEKRCVRVGVARLPRDDAQLDDVADRREHVTYGHVTGGPVRAGADDGVDRVGSLLDDRVAT